jgi:hypothetical protein
MFSTASIFFSYGLGRNAGVFWSIRIGLARNADSVFGSRQN